MSNNLKIFLLLSTCMFQTLVVSQENKITETIQSLPTYSFGDPNPLPSFTFNSKIYPYYKFQGYDFQKKEKPFKVIKIENQWIEVSILPEVGGKVLGAIDKSNGNEFLYKNEVAKFRNIAMRGPWVSGGIEFNFGIIGHHPGTATPVDYKITELESGAMECTVGGIDLPSRTQWRVKITVPPNQSAFTTKALWYNPTDVEQSYYNWMTAAAAAEEDLVFYTPGDQFLTHGGEAKSWPRDPQNRNLSHYNQNHFGPSKSYHIIGEYNDFFGGYYKDSNIGFGHWGRYDEIPGQKLWLWNLSRAGGIWEDLLTDNDGQYIEYQAGRLFVQYSPGEENPISQASFEPHLSDEWTEAWFPIKNIGGLKEASEWAALNVEESSDSIFIKINAFKESQSKLLLSYANDISEKDFSTVPNGVYTFGFKKQKGHFSINVKALRLNYKSNPDLIKRDFKTALEVVNNNSSEKKFLDAKDAQRFRDFSTASTLLLEVIEDNPLHLEARTELAMLYHRNGRYEKAIAMASKGLQIDTYHNGLNYIAGIAFFANNDLLNAKEHLGWAARSIKYRSASNAILAQILLEEQSFMDAMHYNKIALRYNQDNVNALAQKAIIQRKLGESENAMSTLNELELLDPLHHLISFERFLLGKTSAEVVKNSHRSEFPHQTFLELALFYHNRGMDSEAINVLKTGPKHMLNELWISFISKDTAALSYIMNQSIAFIFPYRNETVDLMRWVVKNNTSWKSKYLLGLNLVGLNQTQEGIKVFKDLGEAPDDPLFYYIRGTFFKEQKISSYVNDLENAYAKEPKNWRYAYSLAEDKYSNGNFAEAEKIISRTFKNDKENYFAGMLLAKTFNASGKFEKSIDLLKDLKILPYEHSTEGREIYTKAYIGSASLNLMSDNNKKALERLKESLLWPESLGAGKPFDPEERIQRFLMGFAYTDQNKNALAKAELIEIAEYSKKQLFKLSKQHLLGIYAIQEVEGKESAMNFIEQLIESKNGNHPVTKELIKFYFENNDLKWNKIFIKDILSFFNIN